MLMILGIFCTFLMHFDIDNVNINKVISLSDIVPWGEIVQPVLHGHVNGN
jgi:hypothetical protein